MALSRLKTWISEVLTAADLNAEFNNILNNALTLISPLTGALDADGKEIILDADADTSITADTDDQIDFRVGGSDLYRMTSTGFSTLSDVNITAGAINTARATVASAATTADIWAADGNQIDWTGTTTCTGFPAAPQAGVSRTLICAAAAPFTAGANMLIDGTASGNTLTCAANDIVIVHAVTTTQFRLSHHPYGGSGMKLLQTVTASSSATVDLETGMGSQYDDYIIIADGVRPATDEAIMHCRLKVAGAYATANYAYHTNVSSSSAATYAAVVAGSAAQIVVSGAIDNGAAASNLCFTMRIYNANNTSLSRIVDWSGTTRTTGAIVCASGSGDNSDAGALTGVRFFMDSGNVSVGTFRLYGIRK